MAFFTVANLTIRNSDNLYLGTGSSYIVKSTNPSTWTLSYYDLSLLYPLSLPIAGYYVVLADNLYSASLNLFVAIGSQGSPATGINSSEGYVYTSSDAVTWTKTTLSAFYSNNANASSNISSIAFGNGLLMIGNSNQIQTSTDATTWTPYYNSTWLPTKISYDTVNTKFVLVGTNGSVSTQPTTFAGNPISVVSTQTGYMRTY